jgi:fructosamine-3-kinase
VDLAYLRDHPQHLPTFLKHQRIRETPVGGGSICDARRLTLEDGASVFVKSWRGPGQPPPGFFDTEAAGLRWLAEAGAVPVPEVIGVLPDLLVLEWVDQAEPSPAAAERFGRDLAAQHRAGADRFGAAWRGYIGALPQGNDQHPDDDGTGSAWPAWFAERRLRPHLRASADNGALTPSDVALVETVLARIDGYAPPTEPPARLHGDLWSGNVLWAAGGRVWLIDPSAHGGHRETDLAQLAHFGGVPYLERIIAAYDEAWPLADGWRARVPLHQLHLLLVHTALFGAAYRDAVVGAASAVVRAV